MSYYPKQYPVLERTHWLVDNFAEGEHEGTAQMADGLQLVPGAGCGTYTASVIDAGQAVAWQELVWDADVPEGSSIVFRTRSGSPNEHGRACRWSSKYHFSPARIKLFGSTEGSVGVAADRYLQVRVEMRAGPDGSPTLRSFALNCGLVPPTCVGPKNHATVAPGAIEFHWTRVEGAASYEFELSDSPDFAKVLLRRIDLDESGLRLADGLGSKTYYWRVEAVDGAGGRSGFSQVREFSVRQAQDRDTSHLRHPYLFFSADDIPSIRQRLDTTCAAAWKGILSQAEAALTADMPDEKNILLGSRKNGGFQKLNMEYGHDMLLPLSFAYAITRDSRYAAKARQVLLFLVGMSKWTGEQFGDVQAFYPAWTATLETAMLARHAAPAYDWIYDYLDDDDRARIRAGLLRLAILPLLQSWCDPRTIKYIPRHQTAAGNWWSVCNGGGGLAALAVINEIPDARDWVSGFADSIRDFLSYKGGDIFDIHLRAGHGDQDLQRTEPNWYEDGGYEESTGYAHFGLVYSLCFLYALRRVTGEDLSGFINPRAIDFPYYFGYPSRGGGWPNVAFNDNSGPWSDDILALLTSLTGSGRARYILQAGWPDIKNITAVIAVDTSVPALPPDDSDRNKLLPDTGWCVCRSGWDTEASLLAAKFHQGRGHHDIGHYVINFRGREFVVDSGTVSYTDPTYGGYGRTSRAHNLVLVDGQDQIRVDGSILGFAETPGAAIVEADLTDAYQDLVESWTRTMVYLEPGLFVVIDRLRSDEKRRFEWLVHPSGDVVVEPESGAVFRQDDVQLKLVLLSSQEWNCVRHEGYIGSSPAEYLAFQAAAPCDSIEFAGIYVGGNAGQITKIERQVIDRALAARITVGETTYTIMAQADQRSRREAWDLISETAVCAVAESESETLWAVAGRGRTVMKGKLLLGECRKTAYGTGRVGA